MLQVIADGLMIGSVIALGAIGLSFTFAIFRFSNFSHGELLAWGAYLSLAANAFVTRLLPPPADGLFSIGWGLILAMFTGAALTGLLALALDALLFRRLRRQGSITLVIASFGASLILRNLLLFWQGGVPKYYTHTLQIATVFLPRNVWGGLRLTADQMLVLALTLALVAALHAFLRYTALGRAMRATADNAALAQITGIDPEQVFRVTWILGGALAAIAGVFAGIAGQLRPTMGNEMLLPLFAAVILGGIGSLWGAALGGIVIGLAESASVTIVGSEYRSAAAFVVLIVILFVRPQGLFGEKS